MDSSVKGMFSTGKREYKSLANSYNYTSLPLHSPTSLSSQSSNHDKIGTPLFKWNANETIELSTITVRFYNQSVAPIPTKSRPRRFKSLIYAPSTYVQCSRNKRWEMNFLSGSNKFMIVFPYAGMEAVKMTISQNREQYSSNWRAYGRIRTKILISLPLCKSYFTNQLCVIQEKYNGISQLAGCYSGPVFHQDQEPIESNWKWIQVWVYLDCLEEVIMENSYVYIWYREEGF